MPDRRKTAVITGATSGLGRAVAFRLARNDVRVILLGRRAKIGEKIARKIRRRHGDDSATFIAADLAEPEQVRTAAVAIRTDHSVIDILINNAGARNDQYLSAANGHEQTFACNHLGHFLLTCLLLDRLLAAPEGGVITVSSGNHGAVPGYGCWELNRENYDRRLAYARSKMANIVFASELARRLSPTKITSNVYEPGGVFSSFARNNGLLPWLRHLVSHSLKRDLAMPGRAADGILRLCSPAMQGISGRYVRREHDVTALSSFHTSHAASDLWALSVQATGIAASELSMAWPFIKPEDQ
ncbi:MAG: SDR family NAD(P)-dependent oxidoreductase [Nibricoccus sp.]